MESDNPSPNGRGGTDEIARCPECGRECLWADREHLTHARECPYWEVERQ